MDYAVEEFMDYCDDIIYGDSYYPAYEGLKEVGQSAVGAIRKVIAKIKQIVRDIMAKATAKNFACTKDMYMAYESIFKSIKKELYNQNSTLEDARSLIDALKDSRAYKKLVESPTYHGEGLGATKSEAEDFIKSGTKPSGSVSIGADNIYNILKSANAMMYDVEKKYANGEVSKEERQRVLILLNFFSSVVSLLNRKGAVMTKEEYDESVNESFIDFMDYCDDIIMESYFDFEDDYTFAWEGALGDFGRGFVARVKNLFAKIKQIVRDLIARLQSGNYTAPMAVARAFDTLEKNVNNSLTTKDDVEVADAHALVEKWKSSSAYRILSEPKEPSKFAAIFRTPQEAKTSAAQMFKSLQFINKLMYSFEVDFNNGKISKGTLQYNMVLLTFLYKLNVELKGNMRKFHVKTGEEQKQKEKAAKQKLKEKQKRVALKEKQKKEKRKSA